MLEDNIKSIIVDGELMPSYEAISQNITGGIYIPLEKLELGDKLTVVTDNQDNSNETYRETCFLSTKVKYLPKNVILEAEVEFVKDSFNINQQIEFIVRGVNRWDKSYTIDECYVFGYKSGEFYFAKRGYHEESDRSYAYKQLFDLTAIGDDTRVYYSKFSEKDIQELQLKGTALDYNTKYLFKCEIKDDLVSMKIRNVSKKINQMQQYKWVDIYSDVTIRQPISDIANVSLDLKDSVSVVEPFTVLDRGGFYGYSVPNSHIKMYRFAVENNDILPIQDLYDDEQFSRQISTDFSYELNNFNTISMNSVVVGEELKDAINEYIDHTGKTVNVDIPLKSADIKKLELNNITASKEDIFDDKKIFFNTKLTDIHFNNKIVAFVDNDQQDSLKQKEIFFDIEDETDGVSVEYILPEAIYDILGKYPNSKIGDVMIEIDDNLILNELSYVGIKPDLSKFIDNKKLNFMFSYRRFYMDTDFRGVDTTIEIGLFVDNKHKFDIDSQFLKVSDSYEAIWKYNLANFINQLLYDKISLDSSIRPYNMTDAAYIVYQQEFNRLLNFYTSNGLSIGEAVANMSQSIFDYINNSIDGNLDVNVDFDNDYELDSVVRQAILDGDDINDIKMYVKFCSEINYPNIINLIRYAKQKNDLLDDILQQYINVYGGSGFEDYIKFRTYWLRDADYNSSISTKGVDKRRFYQSLKEDEYSIDKMLLIFKHRPPVGKRIKVRLFYDTTFVVTESYNPNVSVYDVPDEVKTLYESTQADKGVKQLVEYINKDKIYVDKLDGIPFVIIPKSLNRFNEPLYGDIVYSSPYISSDNTVNRYTTVPLKKIKELLNSGFENSKYNEIFPYTNIQTYEDKITYCVDISSSMSAVPFMPGITGNNDIFSSCYSSLAERECIFENCNVTSDVVVITAYDKIENKALYGTWERSIDLITPGSEKISGSWDNVTYFSHKNTTGGNEEEVYVSSNITEEFITFLQETELDEYITDVTMISSNRYSVSYSYEYPRYYPYVKDFNDFKEFSYYVSKKGILEGDLREPYLVQKEIVDSFLDVRNWFNLNYQKVSPFYASVIDKIILTKSKNSYHGSKVELSSTSNPLNIDNWFEGFYTGERTPFIDLWGSDIFKYKVSNGDLVEVTESERINSLVANTIYDEYNFIYYNANTTLNQAADRFTSIFDGEYKTSTNPIETKTYNNEASSYNSFSNHSIGAIDPFYPSNLQILSTDLVLCIFDLGEDHKRIDYIEWKTSSTSETIRVDGCNSLVAISGYPGIHDPSLVAGAGAPLTFLDPFEDEGGLDLCRIGQGTGSQRTLITYRYLRFVIIGEPDMFDPYYVNFYTAEDKNLSGLNKDNVHLGRFWGNPWGDQISRTSIINQIKSTIDGKFYDYDIYYADLTKILYADKKIERGLKTETWDTSLYPLSRCAITDPLSSDDVMGVAGNGTFKYLQNPYIDVKMSLYEFNKDVIVNKASIFTSDDLTDITNVFENFYTPNYLATTSETTTVDVRGIYKNIKNGRELSWSFNANYFLNKDVIKHLPIGSTISIEYEYTMSDITQNANTPRRITQNVVLGRIDGNPNQQFKNPELIKMRKNIKYLNIHRLWIDNIEVKTFKVNQISNSLYQIDMDIPDLFSKNKNVGMIYRRDNYYPLSKTNSILDTFKTGRYVPWFWTVFTKDINGYIKKQNFYNGFSEDSSKFEGQTVFHMDENMKLDIIKTSDISFGGQLIKPLQYGLDNEDIIQLSSLKRRNNFVMSFDFIYDTDIERELMRFDIIFKGKFTNVNGFQQLTDFYSIVFGLDKGISLISRRIDAKGQMEENVLAQIQDIGAILRRGVFYTVKTKVIKNKLELYFNVRNQEEKFYFSLDLEQGHQTSNEELVAENQFNGLNVIYNNPTYLIDGDRIGLKAGTHKINFANFKMDFMDANNILFGSPFDITNYDDIVSNSINKFKLTGKLVSFKRTSTGYDYMQIGTSILSRRNGGEFVLHNMVVDKFEVHEGFCYIQEKVSSTAPMTVINIYEKGFKLVQNIIVNGKQLADEPLISFLAIANKKASNIEKIDGKIFITLRQIANIQDDWSRLTAKWDEYYAPWNLY